MTSEARCRYLRAILEFAEFDDGPSPGGLRSYRVLIETVIQARRQELACDKATGFFSSSEPARVLMCEPVVGDNSPTTGVE